MNRSIVITGVSSGIGHETVAYFIEQGYTVFGSVRSTADYERLRADFPENFVPLKFDVVDKQAIQAAVGRVQEVLGDNLLTALVNNAGIALAGPLELIDDDRFEHQLMVNVAGLRLVINAFLPLLGASLDRPSDQRPGKIINISSISGILNTPINGSYSISKHAVESIGEVYRRELMMYGIDVVSIQAGPIQSRIWEKNIGSMSEFADSDYASMIEKVEAMMAEARMVAKPARVMSQRIHQIIDADKPRTAYIIHSRVLPVYFVSHWMPARWVDRMLSRRLGTAQPPSRNRRVPRLVMQIFAVFLILMFFTPFPGGTLGLAAGLSILVCVSLPFALFLQGLRGRFSRFNQLLYWVENRMGERWTRGLRFTRPDADPRAHFRS